MASITASVTILLAVATFGAARDIPEFLHVCDTRQANYLECITQSVNDLKPYLQTGVPEYNIPTMEPLNLKQLTLTSNNIKIQAKNVKVYGAANFDIQRAKINFNNLHILVDVWLPFLRVEGQYEIDGNILLLPIHGVGPFQGNFSDSSGFCKIRSEKYKDENGVEKIRITEFKMKISVGKNSVKLYNLFEDQRILGDAINSVVNDNFDSILQELIPSMENSLSEVAWTVANNIVGQFSFEQLFPGA